jgi:hypothetical protein
VQRATLFNDKIRQARERGRVGVSRGGAFVRYSHAGDRRDHRNERHGSGGDERPGGPLTVRSRVPNVVDIPLRELGRQAASSCRDDIAEAHESVRVSAFGSVVG